MYNPYSLENKTILVTGASSGIGRATAIECAKLGATVIITARNESRLSAVLAELDTTHGQRHQMVIADIATSEGLDTLIAALPSIDGLSSNAGIALGNSPIKFIGEEQMQSLMQTNTYSHVLLAKTLFKKETDCQERIYGFHGFHWRNCKSRTRQYLVRNVKECLVGIRKVCGH